MEAQIRDVFGRVAYTHKTHEKAADHLLAKLGRIRFWQLVLSASTTTSLLIAIFGDSHAGTIVGAVLSTAFFGLTSYAKDNDLGGAAQKHAQTAAKLLSLREEYLSLLTDLDSGSMSIDDARKMRDSLKDQLLTIYQNAPRTDGVSYAAAQEALQKNEELTFSDAEIDNFLPASLRKSGSAPAS